MCAGLKEPIQGCVARKSQRSNDKARQSAGPVEVERVQSISITHLSYSEASDPSNQLRLVIFLGQVPTAAHTLAFFLSLAPWSAYSRRSQLQKKTKKQNFTVQYTWRKVKRELSDDERHEEVQPRRTKNQED